MNRRRRIAAWIGRQASRITWPWIVSRVGLSGLVYMLFVPDAAVPALVVAFIALVGIKPMTDFDKLFKSNSKDDK